MKRMSSLILIIAVIAFFAMSCSSSQKVQEVEKEAGKVGSMSSEDAIARKGFHAFFYSPNISDAERRELLLLHGRTMGKTRELREKIGRYKAVLFKNLVKRKEDRKKSEIIKEKITDLYNKRLEIMIDALGEAQKILGHDPVKLEAISIKFSGSP